MTACQFDIEIARLSNRIDAKSRVTGPVKVKNPEEAGKGYRWGQKPKYTMVQLLADGAPDDVGGDEGDTDFPEFDYLPRAGL